ncbi:hypothetical protein [Paraburkholderia adhaesiva]|uniref:hypothetical protein n=1 Tax=Paraburkholderia adhaesiva TaxID=2883244 RepID=UPI001F1867AE|nr:hypothetical protein [Paraburkholderia adhaesiva]
MSPAHAYWFPAKRHGWGWGLPVRWQGWAVLVAYAVLLGIGARVSHPDLHPAAFIVFVILLTLALLAVCWLKGEPPRWRWGKY